ncbi:MAG: tetraacyldisaccharide 4'-kinase [Planctomycetota bacterium]
MNPLARAILTPFAGLYRSQIDRRNRAFDRGEGVVTFDRPVISIGNLSVGGTGKTPMVARVIETLRREGFDPCIAMRGYGAKSSPSGRSDEADEYAQRFDDLPIVAQPNRTEGLIELFGTERGAKTDCVVLDDGFQHRRIARVLDVVLIDATRSPFDDELLPLGRLRETPASLARAQAIVVTHTERAADADLNTMTRSIGEWAADATLSTAEHTWASLAVDGVEQPVSWLAGKRVLPVCAIGNPGPFLAQVGAAAGSLVDPIVLRDHDPYRGRTIARIRRAADDAHAIVTTAKDWVKLGAAAGGAPGASGSDAWPCPIAVPGLAMRLVSGGDALDDLVIAAAGVRSDTLDA